MDPSQESTSPSRRKRSFTFARKNVKELATAVETTQEPRSKQKKEKKDKRHARKQRSTSKPNPPPDQVHPELVRMNQLLVDEIDRHRKACAEIVNSPQSVSSSSSSPLIHHFPNAATSPASTNGKKHSNGKMSLSKSFFSTTKNKFSPKNKSPASSSSGGGDKQQQQTVPATDSKKHPSSSRGGTSNPSHTLKSTGSVSSSELESKTYDDASASSPYNSKYSHSSQAMAQTILSKLNSRHGPYGGGGDDDDDDDDDILAVHKTATMMTSSTSSTQFKDPGSVSNPTFYLHQGYPSQVSVEPMQYLSPISAAKTDAGSSSPCRSSSQVIGSVGTGGDNSSRAADNSDLFSFVLGAALEMMEDKANLEAQVLEEHRRFCPDFPPRNEAIMTGSLKKAKDGQFLHWKPKFVAISPGRMTYLGSDESQISRFLIGHSKEQTKKKKKDVRQKLAKHVLLDPCCTSCRVIDKKSFSESGKYVFEITSFDGDAKSSRKKSTRLWMTNSEEERTHWIHAINTAMCPELLESTTTKDESVINLCAHISKRTRDCVNRSDYLNVLIQEFNIDVLQLQHFQQQRQKLRERHRHGTRRGSQKSATQDSCGDSEDEDEDEDIVDETGSVVHVETHETDSVYMDDHHRYLHHRSMIQSDNLHIPVEWVQSQMQRARGDVDPSMEQVFKDMQRDSVRINGVVYAGGDQDECSGPTSTRVAQMIAALAKTIRSKGGDVKMTEAQALSFSREVLLACNRTQSGGNTYEAVNLVFGNPELVFITAHSVHAAPLDITVFNDDVSPLPHSGGQGFFVGGFSAAGDADSTMYSSYDPRTTFDSMSSSRVNGYQSDDETSLLDGLPKSMRSKASVSSASTRNQHNHRHGTRSNHTGSQWSTDADDDSDVDFVDDAESLQKSNNKSNRHRKKSSSSSSKHRRHKSSHHGSRSTGKSSRGKSPRKYLTINPDAKSTKHQESWTTKKRESPRRKGTGDAKRDQTDSSGPRRHRRTASEPLTGLFEESANGKSMDSTNDHTFPPPHGGSNPYHSRNSSSNSLQNFDGPGSIRVTGPRVNVEATMVYKICNTQFHDEEDAVLGYITAAYSRSFVLSGQSSVALGQGVVDLSVDLSEASLEELKRRAKHLSIADIPPCIVIPSPRGNDGESGSKKASSPWSKKKNDRRSSLSSANGKKPKDIALRVNEDMQAVFSEARSLISKKIPAATKKRK